IPLLLAQFRHSENGVWVILGFFISSITVLLTSYILVLGHTGHTFYGVPVHDTIFQGSLFLICGFGALGYAALASGKQAGHWPSAIFVIGALFLINFAFAAASRIALAVGPLLLLLLGWRLFRWKGILLAVMLAVMAGGAMGFGLPRLCGRVGDRRPAARGSRESCKEDTSGGHTTT